MVNIILLTIIELSYSLAIIQIKCSVLLTIYIINVSNRLLRNFI